MSEKIRIKGRAEWPGVVCAEALVSPIPLEGFANLDVERGFVTERGHPLFKTPMMNKVLVFPSPRGSGGFSGYGRMAEKGPVAFVHTESNALTVACIMNGRVPSMTDFEIDPMTIIETGDTVLVNADEGFIEITKKET